MNYGIPMMGSVYFSGVCIILLLSTGKGDICRDVLHDEDVNVMDRHQGAAFFNVVEL